MSVDGVVTLTVTEPLDYAEATPKRPFCRGFQATLPPLHVNDETAIVPSARQLQTQIKAAVPSLFLDAGEQACHRYIEFFTAHIRNAGTRATYGNALRQFSSWCDQHKLQLAALTPFFVAAYIEEASTRLDRPTVKLHLAAIRMLCDYLVVGQVLPMNPAASVRGPKHIVKKGKTPVLTADEARQLLDSIDITTISGVRDRAMIAVMVFSFARVGAVVGMNVGDYFPQGRRMWFRLHEKGGKLHDVPAHHKAEEYVDAYIAAAVAVSDKHCPLFRSVDCKRQLTDRRTTRRDVLNMIKRRCRRAGLPDSTCCHSFRATGITAFLLAGGSLESAQRIAAHESPRTTKLYDRTSDEISLDEIERIVI